jgi:hypothetical protein
LAAPITVSELKMRRTLRYLATPLLALLALLTVAAPASAATAIEYGLVF